MVNHLFTIQVLSLWPFGSPMAEKLFSQLDCPQMKRFWELRTSPETFHVRNSSTTHHQFRWSQSHPSTARQTADKGIVIMDNGYKTVAVPMIDIISQLEELDFAEVRKEIQKANPRISPHTIVAVLEGILEHVYYNPIQAVREQRLEEMETIKAILKKTRRLGKAKPTGTGHGSGEPPSASRSSEPGALAVATDG